MPDPHYPDVDDDTCRRRHGDGSGAESFRASISIDDSLARAKEKWILGLQSQNGAWGAFDADNEYYYLNHIPFADHGALLDPPTERDVSARCPVDAGAIRAIRKVRW